MEGKIKQIVKEKQPFERLEMTKDELREMFAYNQFKLRIIDEKINTDKTTVYRCGSLIDLCRGPHVRHTGKVKAMKVTKVSFCTISSSFTSQHNIIHFWYFSELVHLLGRKIGCRNFATCLWNLISRSKTTERMGEIPRRSSQT